MAKTDNYFVDITLNRTCSYSKAKQKETGCGAGSFSVANEYKLTKTQFKRLIKFFEKMECSCGCGQKIKLEQFDLE